VSPEFLNELPPWLQFAFWVEGRQRPVEFRFPKDKPKSDLLRKEAPVNNPGAFVPPTIYVARRQSAT